MHLNQAEPARITILEPGMLGAVPLDELPDSGSTRPSFAVSETASANLPQSIRDQPCAQGESVERSDFRILREMFSQERGAEVAEHSLSRTLKRSLPNSFWLRVVGPPSPQPMNDCRIPFTLEPLPKPPKLARG
jgi:hypothetical protein